jgi:GTP-binding protein Era
MQETALEVIADADLVVLLLDATRPAELPQEGPVLEAIQRRRDAMIVVLNKIDEGTSHDVEALARWSEASLGIEATPISAATGVGVDSLRSAIEARLPENPFFYPEDELAVQPVRFFVTELIRETIFELYEQEVPYSSIVRIEEYREAEDPVFIRATVYVERESQKPIVIGKGGAGIRELGRRSREKIEAFIGARVYLDLFVKTLPNWRAKLGTLHYLGYRLPASMADEEAREAPLDRAEAGTAPAAKSAGSGKRGRSVKPRRSGPGKPGGDPAGSGGRKGKPSRGASAGKRGTRPRGGPKRGD